MRLTGRPSITLRLTVFFAAASFSARCAGQKRWLEVSSCSNFEAFQARRAQIRFRAKASGRPELVHTLNGSGLPVPRVLAALLENNLQADGRVRIPAALVAYFGKEWLEFS